MFLIKRISFDVCKDFIADDKYLDCDEKNNINNINKAKVVLRKIIAYDLTTQQKRIAIMYFYERKNIPQIANELNLNKSTVSRTLSRALKNINDKIKYISLR